MSVDSFKVCFDVESMLVRRVSFDAHARALIPSVPGVLTFLHFPTYAHSSIRPVFAAFLSPFLSPPNVPCRHGA